MKAHIIKNKLTTEDIAFIKAALETFIINEMEGVTPAVKNDKNIIAASVIERLKSKNSKFEIDDCAIIYTSLLQFYDALELKMSFLDKESRKKAAKSLSDVGTILAYFQLKITDTFPDAHVKEEFHR